MMDIVRTLNRMVDASFNSTLLLLPDIFAAKVVYLTEVAGVEVTWSTLVLVVTLTYFAARALLWRWRLGGYAHRYVLVTGCDTGFGFELVKRLDTLGFRVFAGCFTSEGTEHVTKVTTRCVMPVSLDVTNTDNIRQVVNYMESMLPPGFGLWGVVNNAGVLPSMAPFELTPRDCFERTMAVNLMGAVEVTRACLPLVRRSGSRGGRIINMSSMSGRMAFTAVDYTASKFALEGFSDCLRRELHREGIQVCTINPGSFQTPLWNVDNVFNTMQPAFDSLAPQVQQLYGHDYVAARKQFFKTFFRHFRCGSRSLGPVTEVYAHALCARFPRTRYVVGADAVWCFEPLCCLPGWLGDLVWTTWPFSLVLR